MWIQHTTLWFQNASVGEEQFSVMNLRVSARDLRASVSGLFHILFSDRVWFRVMLTEGFYSFSVSNSSCLDIDATGPFSSVDFFFPGGKTAPQRKG